METDFLNFHDEEHFGTPLYQNELLDDSQSSLLDIVGDDYHRQDSGDYEDHSVIWEQDVERELNGDLAVIPMSGQINSFPKLSNSPPSKDFTKIFSDWQHLTAIEAAPQSEDSDLHLSGPSLVVDMLDCFTPTVITPTITIAPPIASISTPSKTTSAIVSSFDFSSTEVPKIKIKEEIKSKKKEPKPPVRKMGGKNLELLKQVIKEENDIASSFKELNSSDELDLINDNFDITSYVNGDDMLQNEEKPVAVVSSLVQIKPEKKSYRKFGGCYEKNINMPEEEEIEIEEIKLEIKKEAKEEKEDTEEECIDVETVSEQIPVLEARDLNSLLEQFEASEAVNPKLPQNVFEEKPNTSIDLTPTQKKQITNDCKKKVKQLNSELKQPTTKQKNVTVELLQKIRASSTRKSVSLIPARPSKKPRSKNKIIKISSPQNDVQFDHDYCTISPRPPFENIKKSDIKNCDIYLKVADKEENVNKNKKIIGNIIDDTAIRIGEKIKNAINNENILKQKQKPTIKNPDGKLMILKYVHLIAILPQLTNDLVLKLKFVCHNLINLVTSSFV